jgi:hypothetical protein
MDAKEVCLDAECIRELLHMVTRNLAASGCPPGDTARVDSQLSRKPSSRVTLASKDLFQRCPGDHDYRDTSVCIDALSSGLRHGIVPLVERGRPFIGKGFSTLQEEFPMVSGISPLARRSRGAGVTHAFCLVSEMWEKARSLPSAVAKRAGVLQGEQ